MTASAVPMPANGPRVLGFGKHAEIAAQVQDALRARGVRATNFALTDDAAGDARLADELAADRFDGVAIGAFVSSQAPGSEPTQQTTEWFNRIINMVHELSPVSRIILVSGPQDAVPAIERVLGVSVAAAPSDA